jgi:hypothetical protein
MMKQSFDQQRAFDREEVAAYVDSASVVLGLPLPEQYREGVIANLRLILTQSAGLMALDLDWADEAAPVFQP